MFGRAAWIGVVAILLLMPGMATARTYSVEDLLHCEDFGRIAFDPHDRWMVFERLAPFVEMERFDMLPRANILRSHLWRVDLHAPWRARPLLADTRPGTIIYGFSTDGSRLAIGRFAKETWQLGIVTMNKGTVRWFDLSPDYSPFYTTLRWLPGNRLVMIAMPEGKRPAWLLADSLPADRLPDHWKATRSGVVPAVTVIGSGRFRAVNARPPANRLVLLDAASGTLHELASGQFLSLTVAPDSKRVALLEMGATAPMPEDRPAGQIDGPFSRTTAIYDFQGRSLWRPCSDCDVLGAPVWSPGSEKLLFFARRTGEDWPRAALFALDMSARNIERLHNERFVPAISEFPDGSARAAFGWRAGEPILFGRLADSAGHRQEWYVLHRAKSPEILTAKLPSVTPDISKTRHCATAMSSENGVWCLDRQKPWRLAGADRSSINGTTLREGRQADSSSAGIVRAELRQGPIADRIEQVDASGRGIVAIRAVTSNGVKVLKLADRHHFETIAIVNRYLEDVQPARVQPLAEYLPDGRRVMHWLYLPATSPERRKLPLVVVPYPGQVYGDEPPASQAPGVARFQASAQILASHGYAVLLPSLPSDASGTDRMPGFVRAVDRAVDAAVATGMIDPRRLILWGHSHGAFATAMIVSRTNRYAAAITAAGVYDPGAATGIFGPTMRFAPELGLPIGTQFAWAETGQGGFGAPPWSDPQAYVALSPLYRANRISTPMLIIGADRDSSPPAGRTTILGALQAEQGCGIAQLLGRRSCHRQSRQCARPL
jgi:acetyl esterase/lipase